MFFRVQGLIKIGNIKSIYSVTQRVSPHKNKRTSVKSQNRGILELVLACFSLKRSLSEVEGVKYSERVPPPFDFAQGPDS